MPPSRTSERPVLPTPAELAPLFRPLSLDRGGLALKNRVVMGPMTLNQATESGHITPWIVEWYRRRAAGGVSAILGAAAFVSRNGRGWANAVGIADDSYTDGWSQCVDAAHEYGALFGTQLFHGGAASTVRLLGHQPIAPSEWTRKGYDPARAMTEEEIEQVIADFAAAARRSIDAGCDFVEIHGAHGYLVHQFWQREVNGRSDQWGDPVAFPAAVVRAVRGAIGRHVPLFYRFSIHGDAPTDPNGVSPEDLRQLLETLEDAGVDVWDISCWHESRRGYFGTEIYLPDWVRRFSEQPRIVAGNILTPESAAEYISAGHAEAVALARALIADAAWVDKGYRGESQTIRPYRDEFWKGLSQGIDSGVEPVGETVA